MFAVDRQLEDTAPCRWLRLMPVLGTPDTFVRLPAWRARQSNSCGARTIRCIEAPTARVAYARSTASRTRCHAGAPGADVEVAGRAQPDRFIQCVHVGVAHPLRARARARPCIAGWSTALRCQRSLVQAGFRKTCRTMTAAPSERRVHVAFAVASVVWLIRRQDDISSSVAIGVRWSLGSAPHSAPRWGLSRWRHDAGKGAPATRAISRHRTRAHGG